VNCINQQKQNAVFVLWGNSSQVKGKNINRSKHSVIECAHPSPLSATKGFFGSRCFSKVNAYLKDTNQAEIDWQLPPASELESQ
jgi:uracil-DNA glycosylase